MTMTHNAYISSVVLRVCSIFSIHCLPDTPALLADVPTAVAAGVAVPSPASPLAAQPSFVVVACTAADSDWRSGADTSL